MVGWATCPAGGAGQLPVPLTSFVGRRSEVVEVKRLVATHRLVTLTGVGGSGKTRLALRVAADVWRAFGDGVWWVDLTPLREPDRPARVGEDPEVLADLVLAALRLPEQRAGSSLRQVTEHLAGRQTLLVLDNCEHQLPAAAALVDALVGACPRLRVLTTSREPLAVGGEVRYPVPPLSTPAPGRSRHRDDMARDESVALFVARARQVLPGFAVTEDSLGAVAELCRRLDGLPLAIELAAAWVRVLAPNQILDRLVDRFAMLSRGNRAAPARQQALRACVDWSFELCTKPERLLWARLSVFVDGFELDAVEGVCADESVPADDMLDLVAGLVDKSIVDRVEGGDGCDGLARYRMLDTLRDYGRQRLAEAGEQDALRRRHRDWYARLAARATAEWVSQRQAYWLARLDREYPNLRAAIESCLAEPGQAEAALRILVGLPPQYRSTRAVYREELGWLDRALARATTPTGLRARALVLAAYLAGRRGDLDVLVRRLDEGEALARRLRDVPALAFAAFVRGAAALLRDDPATGIETLAQGLALLPPAAEPEFTPAVRLQLLGSLGMAAGLAGDHDRARRCYQEMLEITEARGEVLNRHHATWGLGLVAWLRGETEEAAAQVRQALRLGRAYGTDGRYAARPVEVLAWIAAGQRRHRHAGILLGAAEALRAEHDKPLATYQWMLAHHEECARQARDALGDAAFTDAVRRGRALPFEKALGYALDGSRQPAQPSPPAAGTGPAPLTRREHQIAGLVAEGLSNKEIASRLVISPRTAESHVEHILTKLGFTNRTQIAAWSSAHRSGRPE